MMPRLHMTLLASLTMFGIGAGAARAQAPASTPPPASATPQAQPASPPGPSAPAPPAAEPYTYQPDGRRDPFVSVLGSGSEPRLTGRRGDGLPGMLTEEVSVRGIMQSGGALIALVQGPDKKTFMVRAGDKLLDGTVKAVTPDGLTIVQDVSDPLSLVKTREVRKLLRSFEDAKQ
jgi:Tfp pilus assembly protein PilP